MIRKARESERLRIAEEERIEDTSDESSENRHSPEVFQYEEMIREARESERSRIAREERTESTPGEPPENRHSLEIFQYDEIFREARESERSRIAGEGRTESTMDKATGLYESDSKYQGKVRLSEFALRQSLDSIEEDIDIDSIKEEIENNHGQISGTPGEEETTETLLEREANNVQQAIKELDERFLQQMLNKESVERLWEMQGGLIKRIDEIERDCRGLEFSIR